MTAARATPWPRSRPAAGRLAAGSATSLTAVSIAYPPIVIVALKQPTSRAPPSSTNAAMVRSAIRPLREVPHVTQRSQNSLAVAPQLVTGQQPAALGAVVPQPEHAPHGQVGQPDAPRPGGVRVDRVQVAGARRQRRTGAARSSSPGPGPGRPARAGPAGSSPGLVPDRRAARRIGHMPADHRRRGRVAGPVGRLRGGRESAPGGSRRASGRSRRSGSQARAAGSGPGSGRPPRGR